MVAGAIAGNISPEATNPLGNIFADATRVVNLGRRLTFEGAAHRRGLR